MFEIKQLSKIDKPKDSILIEGLPGMGNVGKVAIDFIIDSVKAKKLYEIYSTKFPHSVFINERNMVELPKIEIYYKYFKNKLFLFLTGDVQPLDEESSYEFCNSILDIAQKFKSSEIITLGGIGLSEVPKNPKVYWTL